MVTDGQQHEPRLASFSFRPSARSPSVRSSTHTATDANAHHHTAKDVNAHPNSLRRKSNGQEHSRNKLIQHLKQTYFSRLARRPGGEEVHFGAVRFPASKRPPAKWACIGSEHSDDQIDSLVCAMLHDWQMKQPRVIISVVGSERWPVEDVMGSQEQLVLRRGLLKAARTTRAWIVTSGTSSGVMAMVGRMVMDEDPSDADDLVCLGIGPWDRVARRGEMEKKMNGTIFSYNPPPTATQYAPASPDLHASQQGGPVEVNGGEDEDELPLDPNHTHFLLVDDPDDVTGSEMELRAKLEDRLCNFNLRDHDQGKDADAGLSSSSSHVNVDTPGVVLMIGGDQKTLEFVRRSLKDSRPVIALVDSGGAAAHLEIAMRVIEDEALRHSLTTTTSGPLSHRSNGRQRRASTLASPASTDRESADVPQLVEELCKHAAFRKAVHDEGLDPSERVDLEDYAERLIDVCLLGCKKAGANRSAQLRFFRTSNDVESANNDLDVEIEQAILSDCESTMNAIHHAVIWGDPTIIRDQLEKSKEFDPKGLALAFTTALCGASAATDDKAPMIRVAKEIIRFNVEPRHVKFDHSLWGHIFGDAGDQYQLLTDDVRKRVREEHDKESQGGSQTSHLSVGMHYLCRLMPNRQHEKMSQYEQNIRKRLGLLRRQQQLDKELESAAQPMRTKWLKNALSHGYRKASVFGARRAEEPARSSADSIGASRTSPPPAVLSRMGSLLTMQAGLDQQFARSEGGLLRKQYSEGSMMVLKPDWTDLMMWAVCMGCEPLARILWEQTKEPTRAAVIASRMCRIMVDSHTIQDRYDVKLAEQADKYEMWALDILDRIPDETDAMHLLEQIPSKWTADAVRRKQAEGKKKHGDVKEYEHMWNQSILDEASQEQGKCLRFVAHVNCQHVRQTYYNRSTATYYSRSRKTVATVQVVHNARWFELYLYIFTLGMCYSSLCSWESVDSHTLQGNGTDVLELLDSDEEADEVDPCYLRPHHGVVMRSTSQSRARGHRAGSTRNHNERHHLHTWWYALSIPRVRFCLHAAFLLLYLLLLTTHISGGFVGWNGLSPRHATGRLRPQLWMANGNGWDRAEIIVELVTHVFTFSRWVEDAYQLKVSGGFLRYLSDGWNKIDVFSFFFMQVAVITRIITFVDGGEGRLLTPVVLDELLTASLKHQALAAILAYARFLEVLSGHNSDIGLLVTTLRTMITDSLPVLYIMAALTVGFGVAFSGFMPFATTTPEVFSRPWSIPLWAMLGDFDLGAIQEATSAFEVVLPTILFLYTFTTTVFLVNLLIAQMTNSYERIINEGRSREYLEYQRLASVRDYKDTRGAPPPLNLLVNLRGNFFLSLLFVGAVGGGAVASYMVYSQLYPIIVQQSGSAMAFTVLHACTWAIAIFNGVAIVQLIKLSTICSDYFLGAFDGGRTKGFAVYATPTMSYQTSTKEHAYLQAALRKRKELDAQTMDQQIGDVVEGQRKLENEQRLSMEHLNGRLDRIKKRFNEFDQKHEAALQNVLRSASNASDLPRPGVARGTSGSSLGASSATSSGQANDEDKLPPSSSGSNRSFATGWPAPIDELSTTEYAQIGGAPIRPPVLSPAPKERVGARKTKVFMPPLQMPPAPSVASTAAEAEVSQPTPSDPVGVLADAAAGAPRQPPIGVANRSAHGGSTSLRVRKNVMNRMRSGRGETAQTLPSTTGGAPVLQSSRSAVQTIAAAAAITAVPSSSALTYGQGRNRMVYRHGSLGSDGEPTYHI